MVCGGPERIADPWMERAAFAFASLRLAIVWPLTTIITYVYVYIRQSVRIPISIHSLNLLFPLSM